MIGRKPVFPASRYDELVEFRRLARHIKNIALPTPKELAERWGISVTAARKYVHGEYLPKNLDHLEPRT
jgi:hypothetical protein